MIISYMLESNPSPTPQPIQTTFNNAVISVLSATRDHGSQEVLQQIRLIANALIANGKLAISNLDSFYPVFQRYLDNIEEKYNRGVPSLSDAITIVSLLKQSGIISLQTMKKAPV